MDIVEQLRGEQKQQQDDYGRGLAVLDDAADEIARLRDENAKLRALLADRAADHSHECIACHLSYTPANAGDEDCPACGCDGTDEWVGADAHDSDCATHNAPAYTNGPCDCSAAMQKGE